MSLNSKRLSLADLGLKIFIEMEADREAQFLELLQLRGRVRQAEQTRARKPARVVIATVAWRVRPAAGAQKLARAAWITCNSSSNNNIVGPASIPPGVRSTICFLSRSRCARISSRALRFFKLKYPSTIIFNASVTMKSADQNTRRPNGPTGHIVASFYD